MLQFLSHSGKGKNIDANQKKDSSKAKKRIQEGWVGETQGIVQGTKTILCDTIIVVTGLYPFVKKNRIYRMKYEAYYMRIKKSVT